MLSAFGLGTPTAILSSSDLALALKTALATLALPWIARSHLLLVFSNPFARFI